jgi:hypothetical protein
VGLQRTVQREILILMNRFFRKPIVIRLFESHGAQDQRQHFPKTGDDTVIPPHCSAEICEFCGGVERASR